MCLQKSYHATKEIFIVKKLTAENQATSLDVSHTMFGDHARPRECQALNDTTIPWP